MIPYSYNSKGYKRVSKIKVPKLQKVPNFNCKNVQIMTKDTLIQKVPKIDREVL